MVASWMLCVPFLLFTIPHGAVKLHKASVGLCCSSLRAAEFCCVHRSTRSLTEEGQWYSVDHFKVDSPWLVQLSGLNSSLGTERLPVRFPVRAYAWVASQAPDGGVQKARDQCISCSSSMFLSLSFLSPFSKNK